MKLKLILAALIGAAMVSCSGDGGGNTTTTTPDPTTEKNTEVVATPNTDPMANKGIGPITSVVLGAIDPAMQKAGEDLFVAKCSACHKVGKRYIGPDMAGVTARRSPEWIMNMILNPDEMVAKDPIAKELLAEYSSPMANQSLTEDESRKILEYFRGI